MYFQYMANVPAYVSFLLPLSLQVDDLHKGTDDVHHSDVSVVKIPRVNDQKSDGVIHNTHDPTVSE